MRDLTVGPRRSEYFVQMLRAVDGLPNLKPIPAVLNSLRLPPRHFQFYWTLSIPLDRLVHPFLLPPTTRRTCISLAKYFDIRRLRSLAKQFWEADIQSSETCETYYEHATMLQEEKILQTATHMCTATIMKRKASSPLLHVAHVKFWLDIENNFASDTIAAIPADHSLHLSRL